MLRLFEMKQSDETWDLRVFNTEHIFAARSHPEEKDQIIITTLLMGEFTLRCTLEELCVEKKVRTIFERIEK